METGLKHEMGFHRQKSVFHENGMSRGRGRKVETCWFYEVVSNMEGELYEEILIYPIFYVVLMLEHFTPAIRGSSELSDLNRNTKDRNLILILYIAFIKVKLYTWKYTFEQLSLVSGHKQGMHTFLP